MQTSIASKVTNETLAQYISQWQNIPTHRLMDAFSQAHQLRVSAFQLSTHDTSALINHPETQILAIHMGLVAGKWRPILQGKSSLRDQNMENSYLPTLTKEPLALGTNTYLPTVAHNPHIITPAIAQEYVQNWQKTPPSQVISVFQAPVETSTPNGLFYKMERLQYAYFGPEVAQELRAMQPDYLTVFVGKATSTSPSQPFGFRPVVLATRGQLNMMFDVSTPVPPFPPFF